MHKPTIAHVVISAAFLILSAESRAEPHQSAAGFPWEGEITASNVYVRSGAGTNYYPTTKLSAGDRVLVLGERHGWYQIAPPPQSFSYVDMSFVEKKGGTAKGTIKQDKAYVRAGSHLENRKSSTQLLLDKGASVEIIGEADGFYKIRPPDGATLYVSKQYVKPVSAALRTGMVERHVSGPQPRGVSQSPTGAHAASEPSDNAAGQDNPPSSAMGQNDRSRPRAGETGRVPIPLDDEAPSETVPPPAQPSPPAHQEQAGLVPPGEATTPADAGATGPDRPVLGKPGQASAEPGRGNAAVRQPRGDSGSTAPARARPPITGRYKAQLELIEGDLASVLRMPLEEQDFSRLIERYEVIATQSEEKVPAQVARIRLQQMKDREALKKSMADTARQRAEVEAYRAAREAERQKIMNRRFEAAMERFDLEGELRVSLAFSQVNRRYRLVDPRTGTTLAYVDIPRSVSENPDFLIGRPVGIKVSGQHFSPSARVPVAVASEVVDLSPRGRVPRDPAGQGESPEDKSTAEERTSQKPRAGDDSMPEKSLDAPPVDLPLEPLDSESTPGTGDEERTDSGA